MTMTPEDFQQHYARALDGEPAHRTVADDLAAGSRRLVRRRLAVAGAGLAALAVVSGSAYGASGLFQESPDTQVARPGPAMGGTESMSEAELLRICRDGHQLSPQHADRLYADPTLQVQVGTPDGVSAAWLSADGKLWGTCYLVTSDRPVVGQTSVYDATRTTNKEGKYPRGLGFPDVTYCPAGEDCDDLLTVIERLPAAVASVRVRTVDGEVKRVDTVDGTYGLSVTSETWNPAGPTQGIGRLAQVTYLDADDRPLASNRFDSAGRPVSVGNLPGIDDYPIHRGAELLP